MINEKKQKLICIGGGGHCKSVIDAALRMQAFSEIVITDQSIPKGREICGCRVAGDDSILPLLCEDGFRSAIITIGSIQETVLRRRLYDETRKMGMQFATIIDPAAAVSEYSSVGEGVFIGKGAVVNAGAMIGNHAIINTKAIVEHDCSIGDFTHIAVGAVICGGVKIGEDVLVGANATVIQETKVGSHSIIGAGSTVLHDVVEKQRIIGIW
ncbi:MAG: acetyltransferase [Lachnospiraceae bacterium]|nr:acetyltransferase [Lachnospiraceae bacterium]